MKVTDMHDEKIQQKLKRLSEVLDTYGSDKDRWPRYAFRLLEDCGEAGARAFAETKALDAVLARAPAGDPGPELVKRILEAARVIPHSAAAHSHGEKLRRAALVSRCPTTSSTSMQRSSRRYVKHVSSVARERFKFGMRTAAALVASLLFGIYIGVSGVAAPAMQGVVAYIAPNSDIGMSLALLNMDLGESEGENL